MMEASEAHGTLWETLAAGQTSMGIKELGSTTGLDSVSLRRALGDLVRVGLVETRDPSTASPKFVAVTRLDALKWARAVEMGIPLLVIEKWAALERKDRAEALRAASDGTLDRLRVKEEKAKRRRREVLIHGRAASKLASTDLAMLSKDLQGALEREPEPTLEGRAARYVLEEAHRQAKDMLDQLMQRLIKQ